MPSALTFTTPYSVQIGVIGAGTMGGGIALAALLADLQVTLYDVSAEMLERARSYAEKHLEKKGKAANLRGLTITQNLADLHAAGIIIEAIPEDLGLKQDLIHRLDAICPPETIYATNTSTLAVTAIAAASSHPERVAGMHFFNPAPVMPLIEIIHGAQSRPDVVASLVNLAIKMGKTPVTVKDTPGFIVNRVARPFYGEALRLLGEGAASHTEIDRIVRQSGGFRMGPFQLMDLIGIDINFAATQSIFEQTFQEPRYRPHQIQAQMVQKKSLGRKSGSGFYDYTTEPGVGSAADPTADPAPPDPTSNHDRLYLSPGSWAPDLVNLCTQHGYAPNPIPTPHLAVITAGRAEELRAQVTQAESSLARDGLLLCQCADVTLTEISSWTARPERLVGFDGLFCAAGKLVTLVSHPNQTPAARSAAERWAASLGRLSVWVSDVPGLVMPRIVATLANEAAFAVGEGVADPATINQAMQLGTNYPKGPLAWAKELGYGHILAVLDHLYQEYHEDRYRAAPLLRRWTRQAGPHP